PHRKTDYTELEANSGQPSPPPVEGERPMIQAIRPTSSADGVRWDLDDLYRGVDDPTITRDLDEALRRAQAFEAAYRGRIHTSDGPAPETLLTALTELESLFEQMDKPAVYASLVHAAQTDDPKHGALLTRTREARTAIKKHLIFFDLKWVQLTDEAPRPLTPAPPLARYRHYLEHKRVWRPHYLSEPEEKILDEKSVTGRAAFVRLFDETVSAMTFPFEHGGQTESLTMQQINTKLSEADRSVPRARAKGLTKGLQANARLLTSIFNNLVLDHQSDCNLRKYPHPMAPRHLANEISDEVVEALLAATERHRGTVQRYYRLKGRLLKL